MPIKKSAEELIQVATLNSTTFAITFTNIEVGLKILLLVVSIIFTLDKWHAHRKEIKKNK
jgi:hypothetical protein|tara:strand:+ start:646 stop:825 length:180 start_codon:yes stop_codon:yes gene_type:complete